MSRKPSKILLVDDEQKFLNSIAKRLELLGFDPIKATSGRQALALAKKSTIDMAVVDYQMPGMDGLVTITKLRELYPDLRTVLLTGHGSEKIKQATEALDAVYLEKDTMQDFWGFLKKSGPNSIIVLNPASADRPPAADAVDQTGDPDPQAGKSARPGTLSKKNPTRGSRVGRPRMIGETRPMQELRKNIERLADLDCPVIIRGENGTGKELTARMIHNRSSRGQNRFTAVNCGCFSNDLLLEELFRPGKGLFAADDARENAGFASDAAGTILLDDIEDLSAKMQLSMLKIIDGKKISLRDGIHDFPFDVRIMASSQFDLAQLVAENKFKDELYYRLNIFELVIPPLRERKDDIAPLCSYFMHNFSKEFNKTVERVSKKVFAAFMSYDFPGNVRELEHIVERAVILADSNTIDVAHLPKRFRNDDFRASSTNEEIVTLAEMEKRYILEVLNATGGNKTRTTELLGISRAALWRKLKKFKEDSRQANPETRKEHPG